MKYVSNYAIHDILTFRIVENKNFPLFRDLNLEYSFFRVKEADDPDIILNVGKFTPSIDDCWLVDHKYYIKENYFYCKDFDRRTRWEVEIHGFDEGDTIINFNANIFGVRALMPWAIHNFLLRPLLEYKLSKKDYFLIHSAAVSMNNHAHLLTGRGGAFKTTLAMDFIRKAGFDFLGDEKVIIHRNKVLSHPVNFIPFNFRCLHLPTENYRSILDKIRLIKYCLYDSKYMDNLKVNVVDSSTLKSLCFIVRKKQCRSVMKRHLNLEEAIDKLVINNKNEMCSQSEPTQMSLASNHYFRYILAYSFIFPNSQIATYWDNLGEKMRDVLEKIPLYEIEVPPKYNTEVFDKVYEIINA